jgi:hypothetical protein
LTQLDGEGMLEIEEMDRKRAEEEYRERTAKQMANENNVSAQVARAIARPPGPMREPTGQQQDRGGIKGTGSREGRSLKEMPNLGDDVERRTMTQSDVLQSGAFKEVTRKPSFQAMAFATPNDLMEIDAIKRDIDRRQEEQHEAKRQKDREIQDRLVGRNLYGIRQNETVIDRFVQDADMETGGASGSGAAAAAEPRSMDISTEQKRASSNQGESPVRAKAKAAPAEAAAAAAEPPKLALPTVGYPGRPTVTRLDADAKQAFEEGVMDQETYDYYKEVRAEYDEAVKNKDKKKQEEAKAELFVIVAGGDLEPLPSRKARRVKKDKLKEKPVHGTRKDPNTSRDYWMKRAQTKGYIVDQINLYGYRGEQKKLASKSMTKDKLIDILMELMASDQKGK